MVLLSQKKDIDKISVSKIVEHAKISRTTFYNHFQDIYELLEWIIKIDFEQLTEQLAKYTEYKEGILQIFEYMVNNKVLIRQAFESKNRNNIEEFIYIHIRKYISEFQKIKQLNQPFEDQMFELSLDFMAIATTGCCIGILRNRHLEENRKEFVEMIDKFMLQHYHMMKQF
jgi:AcrR family transcriptional regulator